MWKELYEYRELLIAFTWRNIQIKYKQTVLGFLWAIFMPMIIVLSGIVVKEAMAKISNQYLDFDEIVSVAVKSLPWAFFIGALKFSVGSLVSNMTILQKIYFPRIIFPLSYTLGQLCDLAVATAVFAVLFIFAKIGVSIYLLWLPFLVFLLFIFTAGLGFILSCWNLFYRDVKYIVDVILTFAIFFTPVFYSASIFGRWESILLINPVGSLLECISDVVLHHQMPNLFWLTYATVVSFLTFFGGWHMFHKAEPMFAERV